MLIQEAKSLSRLSTPADAHKRLIYLTQLVFKEIEHKAMLGFSSLTIGTSTKCTILAKVGSRAGGADCPQVKFRNEFIKNMRAVGCTCENSSNFSDDTITIWW
ncbi:hypothetical protein ZZ1p0223 [Acinetobacter phage ZZ1]|uniref:Uncharacterized protein n=1 Tax=Acinetobacter phage ZZ1 TaxID=1049283 RepID=I3WW30_9CAUD|nr:hypothetical protein ZZ1p0223 [Acinetobacter phage ZZ1]AFL47700.1 hypothetical protein ZZ1p0223 [Acinetobacter phage ZZ1]